MAKGRYLLARLSHRLAAGRVGVILLSAGCSPEATSIYYGFDTVFFVWASALAQGSFISGMSDTGQHDLPEKHPDLQSGCEDVLLPGGEEVAEKLRGAGLRPTRQRLALGALLFCSGDRHVSAEMLHAEALSSGEQVSLATVYNTLHQFTRAGLLRELAIDGGKAYFDTNTSNHNHFFIEEHGELMDIPGDSIRVDGLPEPPAGMMVSHIDVVVRLVPRK